MRFLLNPPGSGRGCSGERERAGFSFSHERTGIMGIGSEKGGCEKERRGQQTGGCIFGRINAGRLHAGVIIQGFIIQGLLILKPANSAAGANE